MSYLILTITVEYKYCYDHFTDEKTKAKQFKLFEYIEPHIYLSPKITRIRAKALPVDEF